MKELRIGIIGLGFIGQLHARIAYELAEVSLEYVSDIRPEITRKFSDMYHCKGANNFRDILKDPNIDAVVISVPDVMHEEVSVEALRNGKAVLLEKPAARTAAETERIIQAEKETGSRLMVAHVLHFDPRYAQLEEAIKAGKIGEIIHMFFRRTNPRQNAVRSGKNASIFHYIGVHDFEMMCSYAQSAPVRVYCRMIQKVNTFIPSEDTVFATVDFADGSVGVVELCWALPDNSALGINTYAEVAGTKSVGYVNIFVQGLSIYGKNEILYPDTLHWPEYNGRIMGDLKEEVSHFALATLNDQPYLVDNKNVLTAAKVIDACFESIRTGMPINIK